MTDDLEIPAFLRRDPETPAAAAKRLRKFRTLQPSRKWNDGDARINRDRHGRSLPRSMDDASWALLRSIEREEVRRDREKLKGLRQRSQDAAKMRRAARGKKV